MATIFTHPFVPLALRLGLGKEVISTRLLVAAMFVTILPDFDVIAFSFGLPYGHEFGHRGATHSIGFSLIIGALGAVFAGWLRSSRLVAFLMLTISTASHAFLDALTDGGLGVAAFWPLSNTRYFLPWQPLEVSPIGFSRFFNERGLNVIISEFYWVLLPLAVLTTVLWFLRRRAK